MPASRTMAAGVLATMSPLPHGPLPPIRAIPDLMEPLAVPSNREFAHGGSLLQQAHSVRLIPAERNVL
jgi:hypothetical protein